MKEFCKKQLDISDEYQRLKSFEMAYIAKWVICEHIVKEVYVIHNDFEKLELLKLWVKFMEESQISKDLQKPKRLDTDSIISKKNNLPAYKEIVSIFHDSRSVRLLLDPEGKYRSKRNNIAHKAEKLSEELYTQDYSPKLDEAINELCDFLDEHTLCENNKIEQQKNAS